MRPGTHPTLASSVALVHLQAQEFHLPWEVGILHRDTTDNDSFCPQGGLASTERRDTLSQLHGHQAG